MNFLIMFLMSIYQWRNIKCRWLISFTKIVHAYIVDFAITFILAFAGIVCNVLAIKIIAITYMTCFASLAMLLFVMGVKTAEAEHKKKFTEITMDELSRNLKKTKK